MLINAFKIKFKASLLLLIFLPLLCLLPQRALSQQINPEVIINGNPLPASAILGSTGTDMAVKATPFFTCAGGVVKVSGSSLQCTWMGVSLELTAGAGECTYNGQKVALQTPSGMYENDLVVQLKEFSYIIGATVEEQNNKIIVWKQTNASAANTPVTTSPIPMGGSPKMGLLNTFAGGSMPGVMPGVMPGSAADSIPINSAPFDPTIPVSDPYAPAVNNRAFPEAGMGGLSSKSPETSSPYDRPTVSIASMGDNSYTVETPRNPEQIANFRSNYVNANQLESLYSLPGGAPYPNAPQPQMPADGVSYSQPADTYMYHGSPAAKNKSANHKPEPAKPVITQMDVIRRMSFHITAYEVKLKIRNDGELPFTKPFMVKLSAKETRADDQSWDLIEDYLVEPLQPGQEVEISKTADGHQFKCLLATSIVFRAVVLEEAPLVKDKYMERNWQSRKSKQHEKEEIKTYTPQVRETCRKEREITY